MRRGQNEVPEHLNFRPNQRSLLRTSCAGILLRRRRCRRSSTVCTQSLRLTCRIRRTLALSMSASTFSCPQDCQSETLLMKKRRPSQSCSHLALPHRHTCIYVVPKVTYGNVHPHAYTQSTRALSVRSQWGLWLVHRRATWLAYKFSFV